jgi:SAM-dependent methyltransferase
MTSVSPHEQFQHAILPSMTGDESSRQEFVKSLKYHLAARVSPGNRIAYEKRAKADFVARTGREVRDRHDIRRAMQPDPYYRLWSALLRTSQEMMWSSCILPVERQLDGLIETARNSPGGVGSLTLDPTLPLPAYHTAVDIHCMPGGYHSDFTADDVAEGAIYDRGVYIYAMGRMGPFNDDIGASGAEWIKAHYPDFKPRRILDMGCTVGHSTIPYCDLFPEAEVHGIDVGAPVLRYAHARARSLGKDVHFSQQNAEKTNFEDGSFDLIVSHILLHETSGTAIKRIIKECHRLLSPGGLMLHGETPPYSALDTFDAFMLDWDTLNNNEPFWGKSHEIDLKALAAEAGFDGDKVIAEMAPSAFEAGEKRRTNVFQGGDFGGGGMWFFYGAWK